LPAENLELRQRIVKAVGYFTEKLSELLQEATAISKITDNQAVRALVDSRLEEVRRQLFVKHAAFMACGQGFSTLAYKRALFDAELDFLNQSASRGDEDKVPEGVSHPNLYERLLQFRKETADKQGISPRAVLISRSIRQLVSELPTTQRALGKVHGIARKRLALYGKEIEAIIRQYCEANGIAIDPAAAAARSQQAGGSSTKEISLSMFQSGKTIEEIAKERGLTPGTIQGHLAHYVEANQLDIHRLLDKEKLEEIERYLLANPNATLSETKTHFGDKFDYGELRLAIGYLRTRQA
jgi:hypothetical protein